MIGKTSLLIMGLTAIMTSTVYSKEMKEMVLTCKSDTFEAHLSYFVDELGVTSEVTGYYTDSTAPDEEWIISGMSRRLNNGHDTYDFGREGQIDVISTYGMLPDAEPATLKFSTRRNGRYLSIAETGSCTFPRQIN